MSTALIEIMEKSLQQVWNERDAAVRLSAIKSVYEEDCTLFEMGEETKGYDGLNNKVSSLLNSLPPDFIFTQLKPVQINSNVGRLIWGVGPKGQVPVQTGMDVAFFENGKIKSLYVFLEK